MNPSWKALLAGFLLVATIPVARAWEDTPLLNIYQLAYPVDWNGKHIMLGARLQLPAAVKGKMPAVIIMHGTGGIKYSGVYFAAALNGAGIATLEIDQWGGRGLPGGASSRPKQLGDNLPISQELTVCSASAPISTHRALVCWASPWVGLRPFS